MRAIRMEECRGISHGGLASRQMPQGLSVWVRLLLIGPGAGMRVARASLPRFGALRRDNTPTPALRGLRMITKALVVQWCSMSCLLEVEESKASSLLSLWVGLVLTGWEPFAWVPWGFI